jgi:branched-chain amino acid aminotransferase
MERMTRSAARLAFPVRSPLEPSPRLLANPWNS